MALESPYFKVPPRWDFKKPARVFTKVAYQKGRHMLVDTSTLLVESRLTRAGIQLKVIGCYNSSQSRTPINKWGRMDTEGYFIW